MTVKHFDIKTDFLYGELEEEIFMKQPEGRKRQGTVCLQVKEKYPWLKGRSSGLE